MTENELLTKYAGLSVKMQGKFGSEFRVNYEEKNLLYVSSKSFAQEILHELSNFSQFCRTFSEFSRTFF